MSRSQLAAATTSFLALVAGCSGGTELEAAYNECVSTFGENLAPANEGLALGPAEGYLSLAANVLTVTTPDDREPGVGAIGANAAVLCVMDQLGAPDDMRREAAAGRNSGSGTWGAYTATWQHPDALTTELEVTQR